MYVQLKVLLFDYIDWQPKQMLGLNEISNVRSGWVKSCQVMSYHFRSGQERSGQVKSGQVRSGQMRSGHVTSQLFSLKVR